MLANKKYKLHFAPRRVATRRAASQRFVPHRVAALRSTP
jgi:hypothetical protein